VAEVPPPLQAYVFVPVPPVALAVACPVLAPKQSTFVLLEILTLTALDGWVTTAVAVAVQPKASVAVTV
jgi:hypothetical protein